MILKDFSQGGGTATTKFQSTGPSTYTSATVPQPRYASELAKVEQRQTYMATSSRVSYVQNQHVALVPVAASAPVCPAIATKRNAQPPDLPPRSQSPMGHLPYPEDIVTKAEGRCGDGLPSPVLTRSRSSAPTPFSHNLRTLTFIMYPETEPWGHREGETGGGGVGGNGRVDSEELNEDGDEGGALPPSPWRGRSGERDPKKDPLLACFFCRGRKVACRPRNEVGGDGTCT